MTKATKAKKTKLEKKKMEEVKADSKLIEFKEGKIFINDDEVSKKVIEKIEELATVMKQYQKDIESFLNNQANIKIVLTINPKE